MKIPTWLRRPIKSLRGTLSTFRHIQDNYLSDIKYLQDIIKRYAALIESLKKRLFEAEDMLRQTTEIGVDVSYHGLNHVIVVGRYKNHDYIRCFSVRNDCLADLVSTIKGMERRGQVTCVDAPPGLKAVINKGLRSW